MSGPGFESLHLHFKPRLPGAGGVFRFSDRAGINRLHNLTSYLFPPLCDAELYPPAAGAFLSVPALARRRGRGNKVAQRPAAAQFALQADGVPTYQLTYKGRDVIKTSKLGLELKNAPALTSGFAVAASKQRTFDETWTPVWGEVKTIRNHYNELAVTLTQAATSRTHAGALPAV